MSSSEQQENQSNIANNWRREACDEFGDGMGNFFF